MICYNEFNSLQKTEREIISLSMIRARMQSNISDKNMSKILGVSLDYYNEIERASESISVKEYQRLLSKLD